MKRFLAIYIGTASALEKWNKLDEEKRKKLQQSGIKAWMEWGEAHKTASSGGPPRQDEAGGLQGIRGHKKNSLVLYIVVPDSYRAPAFFYDLPWRLGRDHGVSAASRAVRRE